MRCVGRDRVNAEAFKTGRRGALKGRERRRTVGASGGTVDHALSRPTERTLDLRGSRREVTGKEVAEARTWTWPRSRTRTRKRTRTTVGRECDRAPSRKNRGEMHPRHHRRSQSAATLPPGNTATPR